MPEKKKTPQKRTLSFKNIGIASVLSFLVFAAAGFAALTYWAIPTAEKALAENESTKLTQAANHQLTAYLDEALKRLAGITNNNALLVSDLSLLRATKDTAEQQRLYSRLSNELTAYFKQLYPNATQVRILPSTTSGSAGLDKLGIALNNNIELQLFSKASLSKPYSAEAYQVENAWMLTFAAPIVLEKSVIGVVLLSFQPTILQNAFKGFSGLIDNIKLTNAQGLPLYQQGKPGETKSSIASSIPGITLSTESSLNALTMTDLFTQILIALTVIATLIIAGILFRIHRALRHDATFLGQYIKTLTSVHEANAPQLKLDVMLPVCDALIATGNAIGNSQQKDSANNQSKDTPPPSTNENPKSKTTAASKFPDHVIRDYDIRGNATKDITPDFAHQLGLCLGTLAQDFKHERLVVGSDCRLSSPKLKTALIEGILDTGLDVIDIGTVPSPALYFATHHLKTSAGIMVTASHNAAEDNGFKIILDGKSFAGSDLQKIKQLVKSKQFKKGQGECHSFNNIQDAYLQALLKDIIVARPLKVVVDGANGSGGPFALAVLGALDCEVIPLYCDMDGRFPNHAPDPCDPKNTQDLIAKVTQENADLGLAFDGDADRVVAITESGHALSGDQLLGFFATDIAATNPGAKVVFDVKCSPKLSTMVTSAGARPLLSKTGHSNIKLAMKTNKAVVGGEYTGHFCFNDRWFGFDDGFYAAARLIEQLAMNNTGLESYYQTTHRPFSTADLRIPVSDDANKTQIMKRVTDQLQHEDAEIVTLDGIRLEYSDRFGIIRASNTSAALTARFEADSEEALKAVMDKFQSVLTQIDTRLKLLDE